MYVPSFDQSIAMEFWACLGISSLSALSDPLLMSYRRRLNYKRPEWTFKRYAWRKIIADLPAGAEEAARGEHPRGTAVTCGKGSHKRDRAIGYPS